MALSMVLSLVCRLKLMLSLFHMINIQGREPYIGDFINIAFYTGILLDAYETIYVKLGMIIDASNLYSLIPVWITLICILGHSIRRKGRPCTFSLLLDSIIMK